MHYVEISIVRLDTSRILSIESPIDFLHQQSQVPPSSMPSHIHSVGPKIHNIACIPGDGIGVDITEAAIQVLTTLSSTLSTFSFDFTTFDWSSKNYLSRGWYMPPDGLERLKKFDAIYFGAVGWPDVPDHISLWSLILPIRKTLNQYVNVRPTRILEGTKSPLEGCQRGDLDWVIVRENSEGEYSGQGGTSHEDEPNGIATEVSIVSVSLDSPLRSVPYPNARLLIVHV